MPSPQRQSRLYAIKEHAKAEIRLLKEEINLFLNHPVSVASTPTRCPMSLTCLIKSPCSRASSTPSTPTLMNKVAIATRSARACNAKGVIAWGVVMLPVTANSATKAVRSPVYGILTGDNYSGAWSRSGAYYRLRPELPRQGPHLGHSRLRRQAHGPIRG